MSFMITFQFSIKTSTTGIVGLLVLAKYCLIWLSCAGFCTPQILLS